MSDDERWNYLHALHTLTLQRAGCDVGQGGVWREEQSLLNSCVRTGGGEEGGSTKDAEGANIFPSAYSRR